MIFQTKTTSTIVNKNDKNKLPQPKSKLSGQFSFRWTALKIVKIPGKNTGKTVNIFGDLFCCHCFSDPGRWIAGQTFDYVKSILHTSIFLSKIFVLEMSKIFKTKKADLILKEVNQQKLPKDSNMVQSNTTSLFLKQHLDTNALWYHDHPLSCGYIFQSKYRLWEEMNIAS